MGEADARKLEWRIASDTSSGQRPSSAGNRTDWALRRRLFEC